MSENVKCIALLLLLLLLFGVAGRMDYEDALREQERLRDQGFPPLPVDDCSNDGHPDAGGPGASGSELTARR